ncbi:flavodoxin family protein [Desulfobacula sp.]|uniref:flavodoxin family protein n=1 Tax=Desulfobacula sp. TaxID=2593537 RepID=UPI0025BC32B4|nr:flavodoxin family protein [Desulfobacula sp.]MBC2704427.1 flavodoxin family protein [Desulfobacula sp.]
MKSLIVYSSQTKNTKKLAEAIYESLEGEKDIFPVDEAPSTEGYDLTAVGFWLMAGKPDPKISEYLAKKVIKDNSLFLFATHGAAAGSNHVKNAIDHAIGLKNDVKIKGVFTCQGEVNPKVLEKVKQKPEPPVWIGDAAHAVGHPNEEDLSALRKMITEL